MHPFIPSVMKKYLILVLAFAGFTSCEQKKQEVLINETIVTTQDCRISISADPQLNQLLEVWIDHFLKTNNNYEICTGVENPDLILYGENQIMTDAENHTWKITVLQEGVIPVMSDRNPFKDKILKEGISKNNLARAFTEEISWGELVQVNSAEPVHIFITSRGQGRNKKWAGYLEVSPEKLRGEQIDSRDRIIKLLQEDPYHIGIMNACCIYDKDSHKPIDGIMAIPVDFNENGRIDPKESHYEDLCRLERSVYLGLYPDILCDEIYLSSNDQPTDKGIIEFIRWILIHGQKLAEEKGYVRIRHATATEIINSLQTLTE